MSKHEFSGKTTEEAISGGLRALGCTISDVKVEVLEEGAKGLFGLFGSKHARVRLTLEEQGDELLSALSSLTLDSYAGSAREEAAARPDKPAAQGGRPVPPKPAKPAQRPSKTQAPPRAAEPPAAERRPPRPRPDAERAPSFQPVPLPEGQAPAVHDPATPQGRAQQFILEVTRLMRVQVQADVQTDPEGNLFVQIIGDTLGILIGRRGETLDALQYLTSLQVNRDSEEYIRVTLDTENYRAKREDSLRRLATRMATRAYKTGRKVSMEPMNPYERRIIHSTVQRIAGATSASIGEEPHRRVVIHPGNGEGKRPTGERHDRGSRGGKRSAAKPEGTDDDAEKKETPEKPTYTQIDLE